MKTPTGPDPQAPDRVSRPTGQTASRARSCASNPSMSSRGIVRMSSSPPSTAFLGEILGSALQDIDLKFQSTLSRLSCVSSFFSPLVSRVSLPRSSTSTCANQFRRHDSEIRKSFANSAIGLAARGPTQQRDDGTRQGEEAVRRHPSWWLRPLQQVGCPCNGGSSALWRRWWCGDVCVVLTPGLRSLSIVWLAVCHLVWGLGGCRPAAKVVWVAHPGYGDMFTREIVMDEQTMVTVYEPPVLVELGEFSEDTLGTGPPMRRDSHSRVYHW
jgi:hypothetical protein